MISPHQKAKRLDKFGKFVSKQKYESIEKMIENNEISMYQEVNYDEAGLDLMDYDTIGTPSSLIIVYDDLKLLDIFLKHGFDIEARIDSNTKATFFHEVARNGSPKLMRKLIKIVKNVNRSLGTMNEMLPIGQVFFEKALSERTLDETLEKAELILNHPSYDPQSNATDHFVISIEKIIRSYNLSEHRIVENDNFSKTIMEAFVVGKCDNEEKWLSLLSTEMKNELNATFIF